MIYAVAKLNLRTGIESVVYRSRSRQEADRLVMKLSSRRVPRRYFYFWTAEAA